jgi:hypothetical protein
MALAELQASNKFEVDLAGLFQNHFGIPDYGMFRENSQALTEFQGELGLRISDPDFAMEGIWYPLSTEALLGTLICQLIITAFNDVYNYPYGNDTEVLVINYGKDSNCNLGLIFFVPDSLVDREFWSFSDMPELRDFSFLNRSFDQYLQRRLNSPQLTLRHSKILRAFDNLRFYHSTALRNIAKRLVFCVAKRPKLELQSSKVPLAAWGFSLQPRGNVVGTVGCLVSRHGEDGITLPYHAFDSQDMLNAKVYFPFHTGTATVKDFDAVTDSVFATFDRTITNFEAANFQIMAGICPRGYEDVHFYGASSGIQSTKVNSWSLDLPFVEKYNQLKVFTPPVTNPGDSGSALINDEGQVLGFAFYRTGIGQIPEFSAWIWAESVFKNLNLD